VIELLRGEGVTVVEASLRYADFVAADEIFSTGNFAKVTPVMRIDDRQLAPGPFYTRAEAVLGFCSRGEACGVSGIARSPTSQRRSGKNVEMRRGICVVGAQKADVGRPELPSEVPPK
jgi:hypothetical protein